MTEDKFDDSHKKLVKHFSNGLTHNLILWIISKEPIHGYGIMKKLDDFFNFNDGDQCDVKNSSSKVYPILSKMEKNGLIIGEWKINENNKRVKYYSITREGEIVLGQIKSHLNCVFNNSSWITFFEDMTGMEVNNEKCN